MGVAVVVAAVVVVRTVLAVAIAVYPLESKRTDGVQDVARPALGDMFSGAYSLRRISSTLYEEGRGTIRIFQIPYSQRFPVLAGDSAGPQYVVVPSPP